ncbi:MAG: GntR family transcriptional regulator [Bradyrhizobiaceae bacterium]|nr:MAG: GntR family transcriptional regulator [Bradyrhizobiaceae bacterium]
MSKDEAASKPSREPDRPRGKGLRHKTLAAATAEELRRRILEGEFPAGMQLRQDALAAEFQMSRIPLREALVQLEAEGLVTIQPHRGAVVSSLSPAEVAELFELRMLIEPYLLRLSAPRLIAQDYAELHAILDEYSAELRAQHVARWGELNTRFHMLLYRHAQRPRSLSIAENLLQACDLHTRLQLAHTGGQQRAEAEHAELVRLCATDRIDEACALLQAHIENVGNSLGAFLATRPRRETP